MYNTLKIVFYIQSNIGTPAFMSDNVPLLPENCCNYKCFGIFIFISFVYIAATHKKKAEGKKSQIRDIPHRTTKTDSCNAPLYSN